MRRAERGRLMAAALVALVLAGAGACDSGLRPMIDQDGVELEALDWSADPCDDFYQFACGNWQYWTPIPSDLSEINRFNEQQADLYRLQNRLVIEDDLGIAHSGDPDADKIGAYYRSCSGALNASALRAVDLDRQLQLISAVNTPALLARVLGELRAMGTSALVGVGVGANPDAPATNQLFIGSPPLGMDTPYFVDADKESYRTAYRDHVNSLVTLLRGENILPEPLTGDLVLRIETALAMAAPTPDQQRDPRATHHPTTLDALAAATPAFDWDTFLASAMARHAPAFDVEWPATLDALEKLLAETPLDDLRAYLAWRAVEAAAPALGQSVRRIEFAFHTRLFDGQQEDFTADWRCFLNTRNALGFSLSRPFVAQAFDQTRRADATRLLDAVRAAMQGNLASVPWLDDPTRAEAQTKLAAVVAKIGFPDAWSPYDGFDIVSSDYLTNLVARRTWVWQRDVTDLTAPVDRTRWNSAPIVVNAFYSPSFNDITFPAAILQFPFFDSTRPAAANYGSIGSVMGHELTHGFDDQGRQYDAAGGLRDWWSESVAAGFGDRAACIVDQFNGYHPLPDAMVNGRLTLGETIADLGGLKLALAAFHAPDGGNGQGSPGYFSPDQQFFLAFAQGWCESDRAAYLRSLLASDPHPPWRERVNGALRNTPAFADAFSCARGARLAPAVRCQVW